MIINGKDVNLAVALPLTLGDWKKLELDGVNGDALKGSPSFSVISKMILHVAHKADPTITEDDIDTIDINELGTIMGEVMKDRTDIKK